MKRYLIAMSVLACVACNDSKKAAEEQARENAVRQRTIDSIALVEANRRAHAHYSGEHHADNHTSTAPAEKKGMSNKAKGALIGAGAGAAAGALTGAAVSKDRGKGALIGGAVGGAAGTGVGYGVGASKDKKEKERQDSINNSK